MTKRNEKTSARVAKIAARVLGTDGDFGTLTWSDGHDLKFRLHWDDLRAVCGSALTQTASRTKPKRAEVTSPKIAKIAGKILALNIDPKDSGPFYLKSRRGWRYCVYVSASDLLAVCASVLTQSPDHPVPPLKTVKKHRYRYRNRGVLKKVKRGKR